MNFYPVSDDEYMALWISIFASSKYCFGYIKTFSPQNLDNNNIFPQFIIEVLKELFITSRFSNLFHAQTF